ncbi:iron-siderophore ABC transporter substrate-binding protein [Nostoc sp. FACHB-110]|nr:iron-siderophore ABC transporter substrate-binding protein [Nostoc sp. FACHB-110]
MTLGLILIQGCYNFVPQQIYSKNVQPIKSECRYIKHELGETCIPLHPQRIVVTDIDSLESLVALGLKPIATTVPNRVGHKESIFKGKIDGITYLGSESQINLEKVVQLNPDLILGLWISPQDYQLFSQIAPTVSFSFSETGWKIIFQQIAQVLDKRQDAEKLIEQYQQRVEKLKLEFAQKLGKPEICIMRFYTDLKFTQFLNKLSFPVSILDELNLSIPLAQMQVSNSRVSYDNVSLERVDLLEAYAMFIAVDPGAEANLQKYQNNPLWQTLNVVKQNRVYTVDSGYWIFGTILSANAVLDDLVKYLLPDA